MNREAIRSTPGIRRHLPAATIDTSTRRCAGDVLLERALELDELASAFAAVREAGRGSLVLVSALAALSSAEDKRIDLARLAHHAEAAGSRDAVLRYARAAGERATCLGAHREAAAQFAGALRFADGLPGDARAELLEGLPAGAELALAYSHMADLRMLASDAEAARDWGSRAIRLAERLGETETLVHALHNGAGFAFLHRGVRRLKGMPDRYRLFAVSPQPALAIAQA